LVFFWGTKISHVNFENFEKLKWNKSSLYHINLFKVYNIIIKMVLNTMEIGKIIKEMVKEYFITIMVINMKEIIKMIKRKEKEYSIIIMVIDMKEILKMIKEKE